METMDDIIKFINPEDLPCEYSDHPIDVDNELDCSYFESSLKEELLVFIKEEPGEDPLSESVQSGPYSVEGCDPLCDESAQGEKSVDLIINQKFKYKDGQAASCCTGQIATEHELSQEGFERVIKRESEENPGQSLDLQPETGELVADLSHTQFQPKLVGEKEVDRAGSANEVALEQSVLNDSLQTFGVEDGQQIIGNAVCDWYSRLIIHGPIGDGEIFEAAHQLAQNFNIDFTPDLKWLENFKIRLGVSGGGSRALGVSNERAGGSAEVLLTEPGQFEPPVKRMRVEGRSAEPPAKAEIPPKCNSTKQFLSTCDIEKLINQLISSHELSKNQAVHWLNQFMAQLIAWVISVSSTRKIGIFPVRLKVASLAKQMGKAGFTLDDEFYIKMKHQRPNLFKEVDSRSARISWNSFWDIVAEWYDAEASRRSVSPGELERKAVEIGQGRDVYPKDFFRKFMGHYGIYCDMNAKRSLFRKPTVGLLRCRFEIAYVVWYYNWPTDIDNVIVHGCYVEKKCWIILKRYMAALTEWFLEVPPSTKLTPAIIDTQEIKLAEVMCSQEMAMEVWRAWRKTWIEETTSILIGIRYFSSALEVWCKNYQSGSLICEKRSVFRIHRCNIQRRACDIAKAKGLPFQPTKQWLKSWLIRILESNGNYFSERTMLEDKKKFDSAFDQWYQSGSVDDGSTTTSDPKSSEQPAQHFEQIVNEFNIATKEWYLTESQGSRVKYDRLKQMAEGIARHKEFGKFEATTVWMKSFFDSLGVSSNEQISFKLGSEAAASTSKKVHTKCAKVCGTPLAERQKQTKGVTLRRERRTVEPDQSPQRMSQFNDAVRKWYVYESLVRIVLPGELERKYAEIAWLLNIPKTGLTKYGHEQLVGRYGLCCTHDGSRSVFTKASTGLSKKMFEVEFLVWYHQWPLTVEGMVREECTSISKRGEKGKINFKTLKTALIKVCAEEPDATSNRILAVERKKVADLVKSGMWASEVGALMSKWSKEMDDIVKIMVEYDAVMVWRYRGSLKIWLSSDEFIDLAETTAQSLGLGDFRASKSWVKRFVELNGLRVMKSENAKLRWVFITSDKILNMENNVFEKMFDAWWNQEYYPGNVDNFCSADWIEIKLKTHIQQLRSTMIHKMPGNLLKCSSSVPR